MVVALRTITKLMAGMMGYYPYEKTHIFLNMVQFFLHFLLLHLKIFLINILIKNLSTLSCCNHDIPHNKVMWCEYSKIPQKGDNQDFSLEKPTSHNYHTVN